MQAEIECRKIPEMMDNFHRQIPAVFFLRGLLHFIFLLRAKLNERAESIFPVISPFLPIVFFS
jgi:hypothetical protein